MPYASPLHIVDLDDCYFYHVTDLPGLGPQRSGRHPREKGAWDLRGQFHDYIGHVELAGKRVLDVGTASGFLSFSAEEAGAREVVSFDLDTADRQHLLPFVNSEYVTDHAAWSRRQTSWLQRWKNAYWLTHRLKKSRARVVYGDVYDLPEHIGSFDVVIVGAILEHLSDPIGALASITRHASDLVVINTDILESLEPIAQFNGRPDLPQADYIFWTYSLTTYQYILGILGFDLLAAHKTAFKCCMKSDDGRGEMIDLLQDRTTLVARRRQ